MIRWKDKSKRYCVLDIEGEEVTHNVNRLIKHHIECHQSTDAKSTKKQKETLEKEKEEEAPLKVGDIIITTNHVETKCPFGVAKVLEIKGTKIIECQWYGYYPTAEAHKPFLPYWVDRKDGKHYPKNKRNHKSHPPYTTLETQNDIKASDIIIYGDNILKPDGRIAETFRSKIEDEVGLDGKFENFKGKFAETFTLSKIERELKNKMIRQNRRKRHLSDGTTTEDPKLHRDVRGGR